jgi:hypothetical protein
MAANAGVTTCHFTLGAGAADTVTLTDWRISGVRVTMRSGTGPLWFTIANLVAAPTAVAAADETYSVMGTGNANAREIEFPKKLGRGNTLTMSIISATADVVSVEGIIEEGGD